MNTITNLFQQAQLAEAAYANLASAIGDQAALKQALDVTNKDSFGGSFSQSQATDFVKHWRAIDQYTAPSLLGLTGTGFSATLFESLDHPGQYTFAIRGSTDINDFAADAQLIAADGVAVAQLVDMYNYWQRLTHLGVYQAAVLETQVAETAAYALALAGSFVPGFNMTASAFLQWINSRSDVVVDEGVVRKVVLMNSTDAFTDSRQFGEGIAIASGNLNVAGHSLGGHLAMAFTRLFPSVWPNALAVNGLGFKTGDANVNKLFALLGGAPGFDAGENQNVYGINGPELASMNNWNLQQPGGYDGIYIESGGPGTKGGHSATQMTDSLALYALFAQIDPSLNTGTLGTITAILEASSNIAANSLEAALAAVGKIYGKTYIGIETSREDFYTNLYNLKPAITGTGAVVAIGGDVSAQARTDIAYRYALTELNPFAITGNAALYDQHNQNGELDRYDPATGTGNLTDLYLKDRAAMLSWKIKYDSGQKDENDLILLGDKAYSDEWDTWNIQDDWKFTDVTRTLTLTIDGVGSDLHTIAFGNSLDNTLTGGDAFDHLYGGAGNDALNGGAGDDHLEGQLNNDTLNGEAGNDKLYGGAGDDRLAGGTGNDFLYGGLNSDTYVYNSGDGSDVIIDQDGLGALLFDGLTLSGAPKVSDNLWQTQDKQYTFIATGDLATGATLYIVKTGQDGSLRIENFKNGQLGIQLGDLPQPPQIAGATGGNDWLRGISSSIDGLAGNDTITGTTGNDTLLGGDGNDMLFGVVGEDKIDGGLGNDLISGGAGRDTINGGAGNDLILEGNYWWPNTSDLIWDAIYSNWSWRDPNGAGLVFRDAMTDDSLSPILRYAANDACFVLVA